MNMNNLLNIEKLKVSKARIAIVITAHNSIKTILLALESIYNQENCSNYIILISDDCSSDNLYTKLYGNLKDLKILYFKVNFRSVHKNRNYLLNLIYTYASNIEVIIRCDADDTFYDKFILSKIEKYFFTSSTIRKKCNFLLGGNALYNNGQKTDNINLATNLLKNEEYLLNRLYLMSEDQSNYELPSCNFVFKKEAKLLYPNIKSAEDHFMLVNSLFKFKNSNFRIDEDFLLINYSLNGKLTSENKNDIYLKNRKNLYYFAYKRTFIE